MTEDENHEAEPRGRTEEPGGVNTRRRDVLKATGGVAAIGIAGSTLTGSGAAGACAPCTCDGCTGTSSEKIEDNFFTKHTTSCGGSFTLASESKGCVRVTDVSGGCLTSLTLKGGSGGSNTATDVTEGDVVCTPITGGSGEPADISHITYEFCCLGAPEASVVSADCGTVTVRVCEICPGTSASVTVDWKPGANCTTSGGSKTVSLTGGSDYCAEQTITFGDSTSDPTTVSVTYDGSDVSVGCLSVLEAVDCTCATTTDTPTPSPCSQFQFFGCSQVCGPTDVDWQAVVDPGTGAALVCKDPNTTRQGQDCYEFTEPEKVVGVCVGGTFCRNPGNCTDQAKTSVPADGASCPC